MPSSHVHYPTFYVPASQTIMGIGQAPYSFTIGSLWRQYTPAATETTLAQRIDTINTTVSVHCGYTSNDITSKRAIDHETIYSKHHFQVVMHTHSFTQFLLEPPDDCKITRIVIHGNPKHQHSFLHDLLLSHQGSEINLANQPIFG